MKSRKATAIRGGEGGEPEISGAYSLVGKMGLLRSVYFEMRDKLLKNR